MIRRSNHEESAPSERTLSDADIKALAEELEERLYDRFYQHLGHGFWSLVWKAIIIALVGVTLYGGAKGLK